VSGDKPDFEGRMCSSRNKYSYLVSDTGKAAQTVAIQLGIET
jgi:hypothetical protein